jgi:hypothetical protein
MSCAVCGAKHKDDVTNMCMKCKGDVASYKKMLKTKLGFGKKHKRHTVFHVYKKDNGYLKWMHREMTNGTPDFPAVIQHVVNLMYENPMNPLMTIALRETSDH